MVRLIEATARLMGYGRQRVVNVPPFSHMIGMTILKIDARGCMAENKQLVGVGECISVTAHTNAIKQTHHYLRCRDPLEKEEFDVIAERCYWRSRGVYVEVT
jgi:hypothetical protein